MQISRPSDVFQLLRGDTAYELEEESGKAVVARSWKGVPGLIRGLLISVLVALVAIFGRFEASAQSVQLDATGSNGGVNATGISRTNFTIANQPNRYLVVVTGGGYISGVTSVTWKSMENLTKLGEVDIDTGGKLSIWGLKNPSTGTGTITASFGSLGAEVGILAASFYNVDQTTPTVGSVATDEGGSDLVTSINPSGVAGGVVVGAGWRDTNTIVSQTVTDGAGMTRLTQRLNVGNWLTFALSYRNTTSTATANLNWTFTGSTNYSIQSIGIGLRPAGGGNQPPVAVNDTATTNKNTAATIAVLANDSDPNSNPLDVTAASNPPNGTAVVNANETITYTPDNNYVGSDSFTYTVSDGNGGTATGTVNVTVNNINGSPVAVNDTATTTRNVATAITVLANDSDPDSNPLDVTAASDPPNGTAVVNTNETITYTPDINYVGSDSFTYTISDGNGGTATGTVNVTVNAPSGSGTVLLDNAASQGATFVSSISRSNFTIANQPNRYLVVVAGASVSDDVTGVTWNASQAMTKLGFVTYDDTYLSIWGLANPTATTGTINATFSNAGDEVGMAVASFYNVHQTNPLVGSVATDSGGSDFIASINPSGVAGGVVVGTGWRYPNVAASQTVTDGANMTRIAQQLNIANWLSFALSYRNTSGAGAANLNWTFTGATNNYAIQGLGIGLRPAPANQSPVAVNDNATTTRNVATTITVLANDSDPDSNPLDVTAASNPPNGTAVVNANETITYTPDNNYVGSDSFTYTISDGSGGTATGTVNVTVNAPPPQISVTGPTPAQIGEAGGSVTFRISMNTTQTENVVVNYETEHLTTQAGDFTAVNSQHTFVPGQPLFVDIPVAINNDTTDEADETFKLKVTSAMRGSTSAQLVDPDETITIVDNDEPAAPPTASIVAKTPTVIEGVATATLEIRLSSAPSQDVTVTYSTENGTAQAGEDYTGATSQQVTITAPNTVVEVPVTIANDSVSEGVEAFSARIISATHGGAPINTSPAAAVITIVSEDGMLSDQPLPGGTRYRYDELGRLESATYNQGGLIYAYDQNGNRLAVIQSNTPPPAAPRIVSISGPPNPVNEPALTASFTVNVSPAPSQTVVVRYRTHNGTATSPADFTGTADSQITIQASSATGVISIPIANDALYENDETFTVELLSATHGGAAAQLGSSTTASATILSEDLPPLPTVSLVATPVIVQEDAGPATFTVTLSSAQPLPVVVNYQTTNGSATPGADYAAVASGQVTIPAGATSVPIQITIVNDAVFELQGETFGLRITSARRDGVDAPLGNTETTATIVSEDPEPLPTVSLMGYPTVAETAGSLTLNVTLSSAQSVPVVVNYQTDGSTSATPGADYVAVAAGQVTIPAGVTSVPIQITIVNDTVYEELESFFVRINSANRNSVPVPLGSQVEIMAIITSDDARPPPNVVITGPATVFEANDDKAYYEVSMDAYQGENVVITYQTFAVTATANADYAHTSGMLTIPGNAISGVIEVDIHNDTDYESAETFRVELISAMRGSTPGNLLTPSVTTTIINDDGPPPPVNNPPTASDDTAFAYRNSGSLYIPVLENDLDIDNDPIEVLAIGSSFWSGQASIAPDKKSIYYNVTSTLGQQWFTYQISDGRGGTAWAQVTITVECDPSDTSCIPP